MEEKVIRILKKIKPDVDYRSEEAIFTDKRMDSLEFVSLIGELEDKFEITVDFEDMDPRNFDSVGKIVEYISKKI